MATYTPNNNLKKPDGTDYVLIGDLNGNMDTLDSVIGSLGQLETIERTNLVLAVNEAMKRGGEYAPYIDVDTLNWMMWDVGTAQYVDTGVYAGGVPAGFGTPQIDMTILEPDQPSNAVIEASGPDTAKVFKFILDIPRGLTGAAAGFAEPTIEAETLDPGAEATAEITATGEDTEKQFAFKLGIPRGDTGENAEITDVTASVDNTVGNPQVVVAMGGTPTQRTLDFAFTGLRGVDGEGAVGSVNSQLPDAAGNVELGIDDILAPGEVRQVLTTTENGIEWRAPSSNMYGFHVDAAGDLILTVADDAEIPPLSINADGDLIYTIS